MELQPFSIEKLMLETRKLAQMYRQSTGLTLPVSNELARFDAKRLLGLSEVMTQDQVKLICEQGPYEGKTFQIKSRVIFEELKSNYRLGQFKFKHSWDYLCLVLYNGNYEVTEIYCASKALLEQELSVGDRLDRGMLSIAKFRMMGQLVWSVELGLQWEELWSNQGMDKRNASL